MCLPTGTSRYGREVLVAAALVPSTALLVPGAAGRADVLPDERAAALTAVATMLEAAPDVVVVVPPGPASVLLGRLRPTLVAAGIDDKRLGWQPRPTAGAGATTPVDDVASAVGLLLLDQTGWRGPVELAPAGVTDGATQRMRGDELVARRRTGLLLVGGLSARHGPDGPLATDERAAPLDDVLVADLTDLSPGARSRLAAVPAHLASVLAISAWGPWQVLLGAAPPDAPRAVLHHAGAPFGAAYATISWRWS